MVMIITKQLEIQNIFVKYTGLNNVTFSLACKNKKKKVGKTDYAGFIFIS